MQLTSYIPDNELKELKTFYEVQLESGRISHEVIIKKGGNNLSRMMLAYGRIDISMKITEKTINLLGKSDFRELCHPENVVGGENKPSLGVTVVLDMIKDYI